MKPKRRIRAGSFAAAIFLLCSFTLLLSACSKISPQYTSGERYQGASGLEEDKDPKAVELIIQDGFTAEIYYGFHRVVKNGRRMPVRAIFHNNTKTEHSGTFRVWQLMDMDKQFMAYEKEVDIPAEGTEEVELCFLPSSSESIFFSFLESGGNQEAKTQKQEIKYIYNAITLIGILADTYDYYSYLSGNQYDSLSLKREDIPKIRQGMEALDLLLIGDFDMNSLTDGEKQALRNYVGDGGVLVTEEEAFEKLMNGWPGKWEGEKELIPGRDPNIESMEQEETNAAKSSGYKKYSYQKGSILVFVKSLKLAYEEGESLGPLIRRAALREMGEEKKKQFLQESIYEDFSYMQVYSVDSIGENAPKVKSYAIILIGYFLLSGPACYLILKRWELQKMLWGMVPFLAFFFTAVIYAAGSKTRIVEPYISYLTLQVNKDGTTQESTFFSSVSPYNDPYQISVPAKYQVDMLGTDSKMNYFDNTEQKLREETVPNLIMHEKGGQTNLTIQNMVSFTPLYFVEEHEEEENLKVEGKLSYRDYEVSGVIANTLPYDLKNVVVCVGETIVLIGDFPRGANIDLGTCHQEIAGTIGDLYEKKLVEMAVGGENPYHGKYNPELSRRYGAMQYTLYQHFATMQEKDTILYGMKQGTTPEFVEALGKNQTGISILGVQLDVESGSFVSNLDPYTFYEDAEVTYYRDMNEDSADAVIEFPMDWEVQELWYSDKINGEFKNKAVSGFSGSIAIYNYRLGSYEIMFHSGEVKRLTDLKDYLNAKNEMLLTFRKTNKQEIWTQTLPVLSAVVKEVD